MSLLPTVVVLLCTCIEPHTNLWVCSKGVHIALTTITSINENSVFTGLG